MDNEHRNAVLAFCEWLDKRGYTYALFIGGNGGSGVVVNNESGDLLGTIASGFSDHPELADFMAMAIALADSDIQENEQDNGE